MCFFLPSSSESSESRRFWFRLCFWQYDCNEKYNSYNVIDASSHHLINPYSKLDSIVRVFILDDGSHLEATLDGAGHVICRLTRLD